MLIFDKKPLVFLAVFCAAFSSAVSQLPNSQIVFTYAGLHVSKPAGAVISPIEMQLLDTRIKAALLEVARQENYRIVELDMQNVLGQLPDESYIVPLIRHARTNGTALSGNGLIFCSLSFKQDRMTFNAQMYSTPSFELVMEMNDSGKTIDEILNHIRHPLYGLFGISPPGNTQVATNSSSRTSVGAFLQNKDITFSDVRGVWQGDYGIGKVELFGDGTGLAHLNESESIMIKILVDGNTILIKQDEANSPKIYLPIFPYSIASQAVRLARPISWEFKLTVERDRLFGVKNTSYFYIEQGKVIQVDNTYSRDAVWIRIP